MTTHAPGGAPDPHEDDLADEASEESFPASDPPATWSGTGDPTPTHPGD
jgi:hypothetical protein